MTTGTTAIRHLPEHSVTTDCTIFVLPDMDPAIAAALAIPGVQVSPFDAETVQATLSATDSGRTSCAIIWPYPTTLMARALADGQDPVATIRTWREAVQQVLDIYRQNRRQLVLVDALLLEAESEAGRSQLARRLGLDAQFLRARKGPAPDEVSIALAASVTLRLPDIEACLDELLSVSLSPVTDLAIALDLTALGAEYAQLKAAAQEAELLRKQVAQQQQEAARKQAAALEDLHNESEKYKAAAQEAELLRKQVTLQQQEAARKQAAALDNLHNETRKRQTAEQQRDRLARRVSDLTSKLEKVFASTSWRATKPLRKVKGLISRGPPPVDLVLIEEKRLTEDALSAGGGKSQAS